MNFVLIVLNYNDWETTVTFLNNTKEFQSIHKIIVVDNCSTDVSFEKLSEHADEKIDVIQTEKNEGYASGNNFGIRYAKQKYSPEYLIISNPDIVLNEMCLGGIKAFMEQNREKTGMVSCKMICNSEIRTRYGWKLPKYSDCILENLILLKRILNLKKTSYPDSHFEMEICEVDVIPGSFFVISQETMDDVGMFDEDTFLYGEENIIAYKLKEKKYKNYILNRYEYIHNHSVSISKSIQSLGKKLDLAYEGRCIYLNKYLHIGFFQKILNGITYKIGKFNYLAFKKIVKGR